MHADADSLSNWVVKNYLSMTLNALKCKFMVICTIQTPKELHVSACPPTKLHNHLLERVSSCKIIWVLSFLMTSHMIYTHINEILNKARKMVGLIYCQFYTSLGHLHKLCSN